MYTYKPLGKQRLTNKEKCRTCSYWSEKCVQINNRVDTPHSERDALCWCCAHVVDGTCQYAMTGKIIEGSVYTQRTLNDGTINTNIRLCPNFERG